MKKFIYLVIILVLIGAGFYLWQNRHEYFFQGNEPYEVYNDENKDERKKDDLIEDVNDAGQSDNEENENDLIKDVVGDEENQELLDILQNHCDNKCEDKKNTSDYDYCLEICGLSSGESQSSDCADLADDFEKNVCYKNQAIKEKNSGVCNNISDNRLKENCKDRVIEELFN